ncbi:MAG TPA: dihydrodipicolinate synthase family protein, partial [Actinomycetota bacterium]|nr:dihydrodipicolinate synthase family protein [Actinomycetota bacterium]
MAARFGAVVTAMVTPFRQDHSLDLDGAQSLARHLLEHGTDSIVVAGSTGESPTLSH